MKYKYIMKYCVICVYIHLYVWPICWVHTLRPMGWSGVCVWKCVCVCVCVCLCVHPSVLSVCSLFTASSNDFTHDATGVCAFIERVPMHVPVYHTACALHHCVRQCMHTVVHLLLLQFTEAGMFETVWQVKYYNYNKRDHCQWGNSFNSIEYECKPNDTRTLMWVNKEMFVWWSERFFKSSACCFEMKTILWQDFPPLCPQECVQAPANSFLMVWNIKCSDVSSLFAFIEAKIKWSFMRQIFFFTCSFFVTSGKPQVWQELHVCTLVYVCESACVFSYSICLHMVLVQTCMYFEATERLQRVSFQNPNFPQKETQSILVWLKKFFRHA